MLSTDKARKDSVAFLCSNSLDAIDGVRGYRLMCFNRGGVGWALMHDAGVGSHEECVFGPMDGKDFFLLLAGRLSFVVGEAK